MAVTELAPTAEVEELRGRYRAFMEEHIYPNERGLQADDLELIRTLQAKAKEEGLWAPHVPPEAGGTGQGESGRSPAHRRARACFPTVAVHRNGAPHRTRIGHRRRDWWTIR